MVTAEVIQGDCLTVMRGMEPASVDAVVTDPPYGLNFMGKDWDHGIPGEHFWAEALRVAKPGAHLLAFGGTRTFHRLTCAIEDAGWEIRDCIMWVYGSGFPKSHNIGNGWGTALKPAWEPIILARKPVEGTVAENVLKYGTGAVNVDGCRIAGDNPAAHRRDTARRTGNSPTRPGEYGRVHVSRTSPGRYVEERPGERFGRWPANLIHDGSEEVVRGFPDTTTGTYTILKQHAAMGYGGGNGSTRHVVGDSGSASRFFYCAKASKQDRDEGLEHLPSVHRANGNKWTDQDYRVARGERPPSAESGPRRNHHPTVKPTDLMRYLCRLVTPPAGLILDPFMGSGSTGKAAVLEGFRFVGIDTEPEYVEIARARISKAREEIEAAKRQALIFEESHA